MIEWRDIEGYEGIYQVSNDGKIRTAEGKKTHSKIHGVRVWEQRILKNKVDKKGYRRISLYKDKKAKDFLVHRLVALTFLKQVKGKNLINHIDGDPSNNYFKNLEWCNHKENLMHAYLNKINRAPNEVILESKVTGETKNFYSMAEASRYLGKNNGYISAVIKRGKTETKEYKIKIIMNS